MGNNISFKEERAESNAIISIRDRLLKERHALLDLSSRNRLLNTPLRTRNNRALEIVDEKASEVFRLLTSGKTLSFLPGVQLSEEERAALDPEDDVTGGIPQPDEEEVNGQGVASRHTDLRLQTRLTSGGLQKRLFDVWYDAQMLEQEQGVNILYLAIGLLRWFDSDSSDVGKNAPLVLLPVKLERSSVADRFKLRWREEPPSPNLTLQAKMKIEFGLLIEDFKDEDEVDLATYCTQVAETVSNQKRWEVLPDAMVLGFFSFSKFLMYRDLDPDNWPEESGIDTHPMISALLRDGFPESAPLVNETARIDDVILPIELHHVVDADSSQTVAIAEAARGRTLVIKGPPGTGKSQTITNIIAASVANGKKILFVAEKMAALEVVHRRLRQVGLGPLTLELHSNKVNKRSVLEELKRTRDAQPRSSRSDFTIIQKLSDTGATLNDFASRLHSPLQPCGLSPHAILGRLSRVLQQDDLPLKFDGADVWTWESVAHRRAVVKDIVERWRGIGHVPQHIWRGVRRGPLDPVERTALSRKIEELAGVLQEVRTHAAAAVKHLNCPELRTWDDLKSALTFLAAIPFPPDLDRSALVSPAWKEHDVQGLKALVATGRSYSTAWKEAEELFNDAGRTADYTSIRRAIVTKGTGLFRFLDSSYRAQISLLRSYLKAPLPKGQSERLFLVDKIISAQAAKTGFTQTQATGQAFGNVWKDERSNWDVLNRILMWRAANDHLPSFIWNRLAEVANIDEIEYAGTILSSTLPTLKAHFDDLVTCLDLDMKPAFGVNSSDDIPLDELANHLTDWRNDMEGLSHFITFAARGRYLAGLGCKPLVDAIHDGVLKHDNAVSVFDRSYAEIIRIALFDAWPELKAFDGEGHNNLVMLFRQLDRERIELAQEQIVAEHAKGRPRGAAGIGPLGVLNAEIAKKRGHLPIRLLLEKAGAAIQQLKPVFMMSPLSVAQFLKPGGPTFDLLVMDEASQIEPVDALGAIARTSQIIIVGDEHQLPPTAFFKKLTGEQDPEEVEDGVTIQAKDAESILELCLAKGVPYRMLSWHYRSRHQSLIAVSNREFYENKLFIVPSPYDAVAGMGLKFNLLKDAPYGRGESRTNPREAKAIAESVIRHARACPNQSLGVATFSVAQRQAVLKELELLRRANPEVEEFFSAASTEPFFVKNLENIQGDERDVILISIGYGKTEQGYLAHAFGPLSGEGGERRLNVLISRAKLRCEVFCNFTGSDIDLERTRARGVAALKLFLTFAETGNFGLGEPTGKDFDSEFEIQVCERLQSLDHDVKRQIGASGFRVDLAVSDPERPGRFILGIECDGAQFHSSRSARDRDRLRQQVLEAHGWIIHRVWSADWFLRPQREMKKIEEAIDRAKSVWRDRDEESTRPARAVPLTFEGERIDDTEVVTAVVDNDTIDSSALERHFYVEANFPVNQQYDPHETPLADMATYVVKIVEVEGPIHLNEITSRIRILWGLGRAGARIRAVVARAAEVAAKRGLIEGKDFYNFPGKPITIRDRSIVTSPTLRKPEILPPVEIDEALLRIIDDNFGAGRNELIQAVSRAFGYSATSAQLLGVIAAGIDRLMATGGIVEKDNILVRTKVAASGVAGQ